MLDKITYAGANKISFREGSQDLLKLGELAVPEKQVERISKRIGAERLTERAAEVACFQKLTLKERCEGAPAGVPPPQDVAVLMADAGMLQLRAEPDAANEAAADAAKLLPFARACSSDTPMSICPAAAVDSLSQARAAKDTSVVTCAAATVAPAEAEHSGGDDEQEESAGHWREDKVGLAMTMQSAVHECDPCPQIPESFVDPKRVAKLVRGLKKNAAVGEDGLEEPTEPAECEPASPTTVEYEGPQLQTRKVVASRQRWPLCAPLLASAAWQLGFAQATRKAFVGDGAAAIWTLWRRNFSSYVPILDFIHALSYVFQAARAVGSDLQDGWLLYKRWIQWVWQGDVALLIAALQQWQQEHGLPEAGASASSPRSVVQTALTYLVNHQDKMKYQAYRRQGLPIMSSLVESMVKQISRRVKGTEKFWSEEGAEAILQLRADYLSDGAVMENFWQRRQDTASGQRQYRKVG